MGALLSQAHQDNADSELAYQSKLEKVKQEYFQSVNERLALETRLQQLEVYTRAHVDIHTLPYICIYIYFFFKLVDFIL